MGLTTLWYVVEYSLWNLKKKKKVNCIKRNECWSCSLFFIERLNCWNPDGTYAYMQPVLGFGCALQQVALRMLSIFYSSLSIWQKPVVTGTSVVVIDFVKILRVTWSTLTLMYSWTGGMALQNFVFILVMHL